MWNWMQIELNMYSSLPKCEREDTGFLSSKPAQVPMDPKVHLNTTDGDVLTDISVGLLVVKNLCRTPVIGVLTSNIFR